MQPQQGPTSSRSRTAAGGATVTTLLALMAVASTASVVIMPRAAHGQGEVRVVVMDAQAMRTVAGAIAAAARDLLTSGQPDAVLPSLGWPDELAPPEPVRLIAAAPLHTPARYLLSERLLDLPPPAC